MGNSINKSIMEQVFLQDLLKGKYINPIEKYVWDRFVINYEGKYYLVNYEIEKVINEAFIFLLQRISARGRYYLKETIKEQIKICEVGKEHKIKLLNDLIKREKKVLKKCIGQIFSGNTIESTRESWRQYLSKDGILLVHHLIFDVAKQDLNQLPSMINIFKENYLPNFHDLDKEKMQREIYKFQVTPIPAAIEWVEHDFFSGNLEKVTTCSEVGENIRYLKTLINELISPKLKLPVVQKITAPAIALFCRLVNESGLIKQGNDSAPIYCQKVCSIFSLEYTDRVRQTFYDKNDKREGKNMQKVKKQILPEINVNDKKRITDYLESKKLYA